MENETKTEESNMTQVIPNGILTDWQNRNEQILTLLSMTDGNPYTELLNNIISAFESKELNEIQAYQYINDVLASYYFDVTMPFEDGQIRQGREKAIEENGKSLVSVYNTDDIIEVTIKKNLSVNQIFPDGLKELVNKIGVEKFEFYDGNNELITSIDKLCGGKQREKIKKYLGQYIKIGKRTDIKRYAIQIEEIYEKPQYVTFYGRGEKDGGFYINKFMPFLTERLLEENRRIFRTTVNKIAEMVHLVNYRYDTYNYISYNENKEQLLTHLQSQNSNFTEHELNQFYKNSNKEVRRRVFKALDNLQNEHKAIVYKQTHTIYDENGSHVSEDFEDDIIQDGEAEILNEMGINNMTTLFLKKLNGKFYSRVIRFINNKYGLNWEKYRNIVEIRVTNFKQLENLYKDNRLDEIGQIQNIAAITDKFMKRLENMAQSDYDKQNKKYQDAYNAELENNKRLIAESKDIQELHDLGIYTDEYLELKAQKRTEYAKLSKKLPYKHPDNYVEIQKALIKYLIDYVK